MTHTDLNQKFKVTGTNARDFIKWAERKGFKVHAATVSRHKANTQGITEPWGIAYSWFFETYFLTFKNQ
jgi:hypothetical protein